MAETSKGKSGGFENTKSAAEVLTGLLGCCIPECRQPSTELQHLGTICKHAFCWSCINTISKQYQPMCNLCLSPLEPAKPTPALLLNNLAAGIDKFTNLLNEFDLVSRREGKIVGISTQKIIGWDRDENKTRTVEAFMATQNDSRASRFSPSPPPRRPKSQQRASPHRVPKNHSRTPSESSSISLELGDFDDDAIVKNENIHPHQNSNQFLPKWDAVPLATSTQKPTLFMTQEFYKNEQEAEQLTPVDGTKGHTEKSFEFNKNPKTVFGTRARGCTVHLTAPTDSTPKTSSSTILAKKLSPPVITPERSKEVVLDPMKIHTLERGAPRRSLHKRNDMMVMNAVLNGDLERVKRLCAEDVEINEMDPEKGTPLYIAASNGDMDICKVLIEHGAIINAHCGSECNTALHIAVKNEHQKVAEYLMSKGASRQIRNIRSQTPADMAQTQSPMRKLIEKYKTYPRQPSVFPKLPKRRVIFVDDQAKKTLSSDKLPILERYFEVQKNLTSEATHFVTVVDTNGIASGNDPNLITAMLSGVKIVSTAYVEDCVKVGEAISDWISYEVGGLRFREHPVSHGSVTRCRRSKERLEPGLFKGCKFFMFANHYSTYGKRSFVSQTIQLADGEVLTREPTIVSTDPAPFHKADLVSPYFILYEQGGKKVPSKFLDEKKFHMVTPGWLYECVTSYEFLTPY